VGVQVPGSGTRGIGHEQNDFERSAARSPWGYAPTYEAVACGVPRVRAVGDPLMPLNDKYPKSVVFVVGMRKDRNDAPAPTAIGTAFFVAVPTAMPDRAWAYLVTAAHVVEFESETWVRVRMKDGSLRSLAVPRWTIHPHDDVAVTFVGIPDDLDRTFVPESNFLDVWPKRPTVGDRVYFIGLLAFAESMVEENVPMVRSGTLGRTYQERVPLRHGDDRVTHHQAHLIDCRSYAGFSGSPCFVQFQSMYSPGDEARGGSWLGGVSQVPETVCLGLISGHWDDMARVQATGDMANDQAVQNIRFPINTGVGIVTPVEKIRECLMDDELVAARTVLDARLIENMKQEEKDKNGTVDSRGEPEPGLTREEFGGALRKVSRRKPSPPEH